MSTSRMAAGAAAGPRRRAAIPDPFAELQRYDEQQMERFHQRCARMTRRRGSSAMRAPAAAQRPVVLQIRFDEDGCPEFSDGNGIIILSSSSHDEEDVGVGVYDDAYRGGGFGAVPASGVEIAKLAEAAAGEDEEEEECAVCLEGLAAAGEAECEEKAVVRKMPCPDAHRFHERCIFRWLLVSRLCPLCRFALPPAADEEEEEETGDVPADGSGHTAVAGSDAAGTEAEEE